MQLSIEEIKNEILFTLPNNDQNKLASLRFLLGYKDLDAFICEYFLDVDPLESIQFPNSLFNIKFTSRIDEFNKSSFFSLKWLFKEFWDKNYQLFSRLDIIFHELVIRKFKISVKEEIIIVVKKCDHLNSVNIRLNWIQIQKMLDFYSTKKNDLLIANSLENIILEEKIIDNSETISSEDYQFKIYILEKEFDDMVSELSDNGFIENKYNFKQLFFCPGLNKKREPLNGKPKVLWICEDQYLIAYFIELLFHFGILNNEHYRKRYKNISDCLLHKNRTIAYRSLNSDYNDTTKAILDLSTLKPEPKHKNNSRYNNLLEMWCLLERFKKEELL